MYPQIFEKNEKLVKFRYSLIAEELNELRDAIKAHDMVEVLLLREAMLHARCYAGTTGTKECNRFWALFEQFTFIISLPANRRTRGVRQYDPPTRTAMCAPKKICALR